MTDKEIIAVQDYLLQRVVEATHRNPHTQNYIAANPYRMKPTVLLIEEWLISRKVPAEMTASTPAPTTAP